MNKIPVGETIAHAYRFAIVNCLTVLRAIALPMVAQLAVIYLLTRQSAIFLAASQAHDPSAAGRLGPLLLLIVLAAVFNIAQYTAAIETALGYSAQSWISFPFGKPMWRLLGGFLAALAAIAVVSGIALLLLMAIPVIFNMLVTVRSNDPIAMFLVGLLTLLFFGLLIFLSVRFLFLLAPVNVAEQELGVKRAWRLSAGNFWRAFLVTVAIMLPVAIINYLYGVVMAGPLHIPPGAGKDVVKVVNEAMAARRITQLNATADHWYLTLPLTALMMLLQFGAGCAAQVHAYRALTGEKESAPVAFD